MTLAVDFGTCNTVAARWNEALGDVETLLVPGLSKSYRYRKPAGTSSGGTEEFAHVIPSLIHYGASQSVVIGAEVLERGLADHRGTFHYLKIDMVQRRTETRILEGRSVKTAQAAEDLLGRTLLFTRGQLGGVDEDLLLTVPVEAYDHYVDWIREAASRHFPRGVQVLDEATACILGYCERVQDGKVYMVVDFGGGTLDVSVVRTDLAGTRTQKCLVLGRAGDDLGGVLVNQWMLEHLIEAEGLAPDDIKDVNVPVLNAIEDTKIALSDGQARADVTQWNDLRRKSISHTFTRKELSDLLQRKGLYDVLDVTIDRALDAAQDHYGTKRTELEGIFLVGGTCLLLGVLDAVRAKFRRVEIHCDRPFEAVARGACRWAGGDVSATLVHDYCLQSWNATTGELAPELLVEKGTSYPTDGPVRAKYVMAACEGASKLDFVILERSDMRLGTRTRELNRPGSWSIVADPPCHLDERRFIARFAVSKTKLLTVTLRDMKDGNRSKIRLSNGQEFPLPVDNFPVVKL